MLRNPFLVYVVTFASVLGIYHLGWSEILPPLSLELLAFFVATFAVAGVMAWSIQPSIDNFVEYQPKLLSKYAGLLILATIVAEFWLNGITLVRVIQGERFYNLETAATHLHVFSFWSAYSTIRFADFLYSRRRLYLLEAFVPIIAYGLMVYRGPVLILGLSWIFVFIIKHRGLKPLHLTAATIATGAVLFLNGVVGEVRSAGEATAAGRPSTAFVSSGVPAAYFWTYLYVTVPIGNLQLSVDRIKQPQGTPLEFAVTELIPDTFSRRIMPRINSNVSSAAGNLISRDQLYSWDQPQVSQGMNISTIFGRAYGYFGWHGAALMFALLSAFMVAYVLVIQQMAYGVVCLAMLNTLVVFCLFNNMLVSAAMIPLLVWPFVLSIVEWVKCRYRRF